MEQKALRPLLWILGLLLLSTQAKECNKNDTSPVGAERGNTTEAGQSLNLFVHSGSDPRSLVLQWEKPAPDMLHYSIVLYEVATTAVRGNTSVGPGATSFRFDGLVPGTQYEIQVTAETECSGFPSQTVSAWTNDSSQTPDSTQPPPDDSSQTPDSTQPPPDDLSQTPASIQPPPDDSSQTPDSTQPPPDDLSQTPASTQPPADDSNNAPVASIQPPIDVGNQPLSSSNKPPPDDFHHPPSASTQPPLDVSNQPLSYSNKPPPDDFHHPPSASTQPPRDVSNQPLSSNKPPPDDFHHHPRASTQPPTDDSQQPLSASSRPPPDYLNQPRTMYTKPPPVPLAVANVTLRASDLPGELFASWEEPAGHKEGYLLILHHTESGQVAMNKSLEAGASEFWFRDLEPGSEYMLDIATLSGPYRPTTRVNEWTCPSPPSKMTMQNLGSTSSLHAAWDNPFGAAWFHLTLHNMASQAVMQALSAKRGVREYSFQGLTPGTRYFLVIIAASGPFRTLGPNVTEWTYPLAPTNVSLWNSGSASTLQAQWSQAVGERDSYVVTLHNTETEALEKNITTAGHVTHLNVDGLTPGNQYSIRVAATAGPYQATSQDAVAWTSPLAPSGVHLSSQGSLSTLIARWDRTTGSHYAIKLYSTEPFVLLQNKSLERDVTNCTYQSLVPGTQYLVEISTVAGPHTSAAQSATEWTYPLAPELVSLQTQGVGFMKATWLAPPVGPRCTYRATLSETRSRVVVRNATLKEGSTELPLEGLVPGRQYSFQIYSVAGPYSSPAQMATNWTYPAVPHNVALTNRGQPYTIYASWDTPPGDQDAFSILLYSSDLALESNTSLGPDQHNLTLDGLQPGKRYSLEVSAIAGPYGSPAATAGDWTYPLPPAALKVDNIQSSSSLFVHWIPAEGGGEMWLLLYTDNSPSAFRNISVGPGATNITLEDLQPGTRYLLQTVTQAGPYQTTSPRVPGYTYPLAPPALKVTSGGDPTSLIVEWEIPAGEREGHVVSLSKLGDGMLVNQITTVKDSTGVTFTDLMPGTWYNVHVHAVAGMHFQSDTQNITACTVPLAPTDVKLTNKGSSTTLHATWVAPAGDRDSYRLILLNDQDQSVVRGVSIGNNQTHWTFSDLSAGTQYILRVAATCQAQETFSPNLMEWTYPLVPLNLTLSNLGNPSSLRASWEESSGGRERYIIALYDASSGSVARQATVGKNIKNVTFGDLTPGKRYSAEVSAVAGHYKATARNATNSTCPFAPLRVKVENAGHADMLHASWDEADGTRDGYEAILHNVRLQRIAGVASMDGDAKSYLFTDLTAGNEYQVQIEAFTGFCRNSSGNITEWTHPLPPSRVSLDNERSQDTLRVLWEEDAGERDRYAATLYSEEGRVIAGEASIEGSGRNYSFTGLTAGGKYTAAVVSVAGPYRALAVNVTEWTYPLAPSGVRATNAGTADELQVFWEEGPGERDGYLAVLYDLVSHGIWANASVGSHIRNFNFSGLTPGRKYAVEIAAFVGHYRTRASNVTDWTFPLAPTKVSSTNQGSPYRLHAFWEEAAGERDEHNAVLYDTLTGAITRNASAGRDTREITFSSLIPGSKYNIEIVAKAGWYQSSAANITDWTYPLAPSNVSVVIEENNTVLVLSWSESSGRLDSYQAWLVDLWNGTGSRNQTLAKERDGHAFHGLIPGRNYSVSVSSAAGPYRNSSRSLMVPVEPNPVTAAHCWANETGLYLNWSQPLEQTDSCLLDVGSLSEVALRPVLTMQTTETEAILRNLAPNTSYHIGLTLRGSNGMKSRTVILVCNTSQEVLPPPPSDSAPLFDGEAGVIISSDMFSEENGRIEYFGIIVTSNTSLSRPTQPITTSTWYDHYYGQEETYLAVLVPNPFQPRQRDAANRTSWAVPVGTDDCSQTREICNGKLKTDTQYRFSVAAFTRYDALDPAVSFSAFSASPTDVDSSPVPIPIVAGVIGGVLLTGIVILGLIYWRRSRVRRRRKNHPTQEMTAYTLRNIHRPIPIQNFKQVYEMKTASASQIFFQEFEELKEVGKDQSKIEAELPENVSKNRYPHVLPYDHSRVKLSPIGNDPTSDYINANFIPGYIGYQEYISTQGPLKKTIEDFWRLIWEYNVRNVVMLTVCMENGRVLCDHYWPSDGTPTSYGQISVRLVAQDISSEWTKREFRLWNDGLKLERDVHQLHYTAWPDHGLPESTTSMVYFVEMVQEHIQASKGSGPTVVHSSAGVGRTGTFIGLDRLLQQLKQERVVDVFRVVYTMRMCRYLMVQTLRQYIFLHTCILDKIIEDQLSGFGDKETSRPILQKTFSQHYLKKSANGNAGFLQEYEVLLEVAKDEVRVDQAVPAAVTPQTQSYSGMLPYDRCRVKFSPVGPDPLSDGAKAWFIPPPGVECWPSDSSPICTGSLSIQNTAMKNVMGWKCMHLKMKHEKKMKERLIHHFNFPLWNEEDEPNADNIIKFLAVLQQSAPSRRRSAPLLIHCSAGVGQMGTILAMDNLLHQAKTDKSVDVYAVTLRIAKSCCFMTPTLDQYVFLHAFLKNQLSEKQS
ncbi:receptor-type tyrosine-protein phosphatase V-like isoform X2 [Ambystoma mexicanum]|uniref:receptor-type tyrosine-protein phosphatase V-like isoform X2 n=1 Tax=Ambystoma mexicanum TaxID=8296 RepID=UPI0037E7EB2F